MFIFYNATDLSIHHVIDHHPENYESFLASRSDVGAWIKTDEVIPLNEIYLVKNGGGEVTATRKTAFPEITAPTSMTVGAEITLTGILEGAGVFINGMSYGAMDATGTLEFTATTAGTYNFRFEKLGFTTKEISIEAVS
jgi:hypothetical protein